MRRSPGLRVITAVAALTVLVSCDPGGDAIPEAVRSQRESPPRAARGARILLGQSPGGPVLIAAEGGSTISFLRREERWRPVSRFVSDEAHVQSIVVGDADQLVTVGCSDRLDDEGNCIGTWSAIYSRGADGSAVSTLDGTASAVLATDTYPTVWAIGADGATSYLLFEERSADNLAEIWALDRSAGGWRRLPHVVDRDRSYCVLLGDVVVEMTGVTTPDHGSASADKPYREPTADAATVTKFDSTGSRTASGRVDVGIDTRSRLACPASRPAIVGISEVAWLDGVGVAGRTPLPASTDESPSNRSIVWSPSAPQVTVSDRTGATLSLTAVTTNGEPTRAVTDIGDTSVVSPVMDTASHEFLSVETTGRDAAPASILVTPAG